jgi:hypothetical protein
MNAVDAKTKALQVKDNYVNDHWQKNYNICLAQIENAVKNGRLSSQFSFSTDNPILTDALLYKVLTELQKLGYKVQHTRGQLNISW